MPDPAIARPPHRRSGTRLQPVFCRPAATPLIVAWTSRSVSTRSRSSITSPHQQATLFDLYINKAVWDGLPERDKAIIDRGLDPKPKGCEVVKKKAPAGAIDAAG